MSRLLSGIISSAAKLSLARKMASATIPTLYYFKPCPSCIPILMIAKNLDLNLNLVHVDIWNKEHLQPEFLKVNPAHTVPVLIDGDLVLPESRAIACYLVNKYKPGDKMYPGDPVLRSQVDRYLYFDIGTLYNSMIQTFYPKMARDEEISPVKEELFKDKMTIFDQLLTGKQFVTGENVCLPDFTIFGHLIVAKIYGYDFSQWPNVSRWFKNFESIAGYQDLAIDPLVEFRKRKLLELEKEKKN